MKKCKRFQFSWTDRKLSLCNQLEDCGYPNPEQAHYWKDVTCKECIKLKEKLGL